MYVGQTWETVCDDGFYTSDARVVCRQLRYNVDQTGTCKFNDMDCVYAILIHRCMPYGQGSGFIWLDDLRMKRGYWIVQLVPLVVIIVDMVKMLE